MPSQTKTGRRYGAIYAFIREAGPTLGTFTWRDLTPLITASQAHSALRHLMQRGEVERVTEATRGRWAKAAQYTFVTQSQSHDR